MSIESISSLFDQNTGDKFGQIQRTVWIWENQKIYSEMEETRGIRFSNKILENFGTRSQ